MSCRVVPCLDWRVELVDEFGQAINSGNPLPTSTGGGGGMVVQGNKTNNAAVPGSNNFGVLPALANAAAPTWTEGNLVLLSTDLSGNLRTINTPSGIQPISGTVAISNFPATQPISGTVTANQGTAAGAAGGWPIRASDGSNLINVGDNANSAIRVNVVASIGGGSVVSGSKSNNSVVPGSTNLGVLPALANASAPSWTEGNQVLLSTDLAGNLRVTSTGGGGGGLSVVDESAWTAGVSAFTPSGGVFNDSATALTSGQQGTERLTPNRAVHVNLRNQSGAEIGTSGTPVRTDPTGTTTQPVSGTITSNAGTGTFTVGGTVAVSNFPGTQAVSGTVAVTQSTSPWVVSGTVTSTPSGTQTVQGNKTNNNTAPGATNLGVLPALANASAPSWTEGNQVLLSTDLLGNLRTINTPSGTQAISGTVTANAGTGTFTVGGTVAVSNFPATQAVSGTVTANQGTANTLANAWPVEVTDGTNVLGTSTHPLRSDPTGTTPQPVTGTFFQTTQPISGTVTANAGTGNFSVVGTKSNNAVVPGATNLGVLPAIANAAAPSYTEGNQVLLSTDLSGMVRVVGGKTNNSAAPTTNLAVLPALANAASPTLTEGFTNLLSVDLSGNLRTINTPSGTQAISGTVTANQGTSPWTTQGAQAPGSAITTNPFVVAGQNGGNVKLWAINASGAGVITGSLAANSLTPGTDFIEALTTVSTAAAPTYIEGKVNTLSTDLSGNLRVAGSFTAGLVAAELVVMTTGGNGAGITATLPAVAGQFHYITAIEIDAFNTASTAGLVTPYVVTTTNLPGGLAYAFSVNNGSGHMEREIIEPPLPLKSSVVNTATTIVCPATTSIVWRVTVYYHAAP